MGTFLVKLYKVVWCYFCMAKNYVEELRGLIEKYRGRGFEYGKPIEYLEFRNSMSREKMEEEILSCLNLKYVGKQYIDEEKRYALYYVYSGSRGRTYVLRFTEKIRIVTVYPIGRMTLRKYKKVRFNK